MKSKENLTDQNKAAKKSFLIKKNGSNQSSVHNKTHAHNDVPPSQIEFVIMFYNNYCNAQLIANSRPLAICHVIQIFDVSIEDFHWHEKTILSSFKTDLDDWEDKDDKSKWVPCDGLLKRKKISHLFLVLQPNPIHICTLHGPLILVYEFRRLFTKINMKCQVCIKITQDNNGCNQSTIKNNYNFCLV